VSSLFDYVITSDILQRDSNEDFFETQPPALSGLVVTNPLLDWNYTTTPQNDANEKSAIYFRGKLLGGCSSHSEFSPERLWYDLKILKYR
jgi:choline dehydrogenase-like flavoprotein